MQKWEYCCISGMSMVTPQYPAFYKFTDKGYEMVSSFDKLPKGLTQTNAVGQFIAKLGFDGWEMVGMGATHSGQNHTLYFKRPKE